MKKLVRGLFGPFPILPFYVGLFGFTVTIYGLTHFDRVHTTFWSAYADAIPEALISGLALGLPALLAKKVLAKIDRPGARTFTYYTLLILGSLVYTWIQHQIFPNDFNEGSVIAGAFTVDYLRNIIPAILIVNVIGYLYARLHKEIEEKEAAFQLVQAQNNALIAADERSRQTVANFLHDRVQAALVTVSMQIGEIAKSLTQKDSSKLNSIIAEIEHIRGVDVRTAAQRLSPDLSVIGLANALTLFADSLRPVTTTKIITDSFTEEWLKPAADRAETQLGIYRICEQALLNAAVHGRATEIEIFITRATLKMAPHIIVDVINNGEAVVGDLIPGTGFAVKNGWVSILKAQQNLSNISDGRVKYHLEIPL